MELSNIRVEKKETSKLCIDVMNDNKKTTLWYEVPNEYSECLCVELADAFLVVLILYAMEKNENIIIKNVPVTDTLLFNIKNYLIPTLSKNIDKYHEIDIIADTAHYIFKKNGNGTGISRGIDSFYTINEFTNECPNHMKINYLTFFNIGSHGEYDSKKAYDLFKKRLKNSKDFAEKNGFNFIPVNTNISDFILQEFEETHTFRNLSIAFALQKLFNNYYYSSGININEFKISEKDTAFYDVYIMYLFSTDNIKFISSGVALDRIDKVKKVSTYKPSYENLSVCFKDEYNCGKCEKCIRTIFELYALKELDKYNKVFDVENFYKNINWYETKFFENYFKNNGELEYRITYNVMKKNKVKVKMLNIIKGGCIAFAKKLYHKIVK